MPILFCYGLPTSIRMSEKNSLACRTLALSFSRIPELELSVGDISIISLQETDNSYGNSKKREAVIVIDALFETPKRTTSVIQRLVETVGELVNDMLKSVTGEKWLVECYPRMINPEKGFYSSKKTSSKPPQ